MEIIYLGHSSFKLKGKDKIVITDPYDPSKVGLKFPKNEADIVTVSHSHSDHGYLDLVSGVSKVISGPGEYEIGGVSIIGYSSFHDNEKGAARGMNTIFLIEIDKVRVVHLGDLGHVLSQSLVSEIGVIDVALIPVGGVYTIDPKEAVEVASLLAPKVIIPMHYKVPGLSLSQADKMASVEDFLKLSQLKVERVSKLVVKSNENAEEQTIYVLEKK